MERALLPAAFDFDLDLDREGHDSSRAASRRENGIRLQPLRESSSTRDIIYLSLSFKIGPKARAAMLLTRTH